MRFPPPPCRLLYLIMVAHSLVSLPISAAPLRFILPTQNQALFSDKPEEYYMYVNRYIDGKATKPWQGGTWGFVRNLRKTEDGTIGTRFHEGIDIKPTKRDETGQPLDKIKSVAPGIVVHTNDDSRKSNYGKYLVVEHNWGDGPIYSLYAHLSQINVQTGQRVPTGHTLGVMGYTGRGINKTRSHLHFELNILLSPNFETWAIKYLGGVGAHGIYNGLNLSGMNYPELMLALRKNPNTSFTSIIRKTPPHYKIAIPRRGTLSLAQRYPWLRFGQHSQPSPSWEITFTASGFPLAIRPSNREVEEPLVTSVRPVKSRHEYYTLGRVSGTGRRADLTGSGLRYIELLSTTLQDIRDAQSEP